MVLLLLSMVSCSSNGGSSSPGGNAPAITTFAATPMTITSGASVTLRGVFSNGTGVVMPGSLALTSGTGLTVTPTATTSYVLTVTNAAGLFVTQDAGVTVVPAGALINSTNSVPASGVQQTSPGGTFSNGPVVGESLPATTVSTPSNSLQVRHDFLPPRPAAPK